MNEFTVEETTPSPASPIAPPRWTGTASITLAHQLNEQCIEMLCEVAATLDDAALPAFVLRNRDLWCRLDTEARKRITVFPFVIVDLRFQDTEWWRELGERYGKNVPDRTPSNNIPPKFCEDLLLETIMFARQAAREDRHVAQVMFAMTRAVADRIASLTMQQARAIAFGNTRHLRVRWDNDAEFWRELLIASRKADEGALSALRHHAKLLFCGEGIQSGERSNQ